MEKLIDRIDDIQKQIDDLYNQLIALRVDNMKLLGKLKDLEWFLYEE